LLTKFWQSFAELRDDGDEIGGDRDLNCEGEGPRRQYSGVGFLYPIDRVLSKGGGAFLWVFPGFYDDLRVGYGQLMRRTWYIPQLEFGRLMTLTKTNLGREGKKKVKKENKKSSCIISYVISEVDRLARSPDQSKCENAKKGWEERSLKNGPRTRRAPCHGV